MRKQNEIIETLKERGYSSGEAYAWAWGFLSSRATDEDLNTLLTYLSKQEVDN
jgi:hypothetical protein